METTTSPGNKPKTNSGAPADDVLLDIRDLRTYFHTQDGVVKAVNGVDFSVHRGEIVGLVGESGCGKSVTSLSAMRLIAYPGKIETGEIWFDGVNLLTLPRREMTRIRGSRISMIFQQPTSCLNPVYDTGYQLAEVLMIHESIKQHAGQERAIELLRVVASPTRRSASGAIPTSFQGAWPSG